MRRSLISASKLVESGFIFTGDSESVKIFHSNNKDILPGHAFLKTDMWQLECAYVNKCFNVNVAGSKRVLTDETSPMLCHISRERIITLMKQYMLPQLNFDNFNDCIDCFKGKLTNARKNACHKKSKFT